MSQSLPNIRAAPTGNFDAAEFMQAQAAVGPDATAAQIAMLNTLVQQLRQSVDQSGKAQASEIRQLMATSLASVTGDGMMDLVSGKPFEWMYQKPSAVFYPVSTHL